MKRRNYLVASARVLTAGTAGLAGCLSSVDEQDASMLGEVDILNLDDQSHTVEFRVQWEGEIVHDSSYQVPGDDTSGDNSVVPDRSWPDESGQFTVEARMEDEQWQSVDPADKGFLIVSGSACRSPEKAIFG